MKKYIIAFISAVLLFSSCEKQNTIQGEGPQGTEDRTLLVQQGFTSIRISGSTDARILFAPNYKLEVKGYNNLMNALRTEVRGGTLYVSFPDHYNVKNDNTEIVLTIPRIPNLELNGNIQAEISGTFPAQASLNFRINGSGDIEANEAQALVEESEFSINGSGEIQALNILARSAKGRISGSGTIATSVSNVLDVDISGSGDFLYRGNPVVTSRISGSGKVQRLN